MNFMIKDGILEGYDGPGGCITIPEGVHTIGINAFLERSDIEKVIFPKGLRSIQYGAFCLCGSLKEIVLNNDLDEICEGAFEFCPSLTRVVIPKNVYAVLPTAFAWCSGLETVIFEGGNTDFAEDTFIGCPNICLFVPKGSKTAEYAREEQLPYREYSTCE